MADARSILAILLLCAVAGMVVDLEIHGEDEDAVLALARRHIRQLGIHTIAKSRRWCYAHQTTLKARPLDSTS